MQEEIEQAKKDREAQQEWLREQLEKQRQDIANAAATHNKDEADRKNKDREDSEKRKADKKAKKAKKAEDEHKRLQLEKARLEQEKKALEDAKVRVAVEGIEAREEAKRSVIREAEEEAFQKMKALEQFEREQRQNEEMDAASKIQRVYRGRQGRKVADKKREEMVAKRNQAATKIQAVWRGHAARRYSPELEEQRVVNRRNRAATKIQAAYRGSRTRAEVKKMRGERAKTHQAAAKIQAMYRGVAARERIGRQISAAVLIQAVQRGHSARQFVKRLREAKKMAAYAKHMDKIILIQKAWRGFVTREWFKANRVYLEIARARRTVRKTLTLLGPAEGGGGLGAHLPMSAIMGTAPLGAAKGAARQRGPGKAVPKGPQGRKGRKPVQKANGKKLAKEAWSTAPQPTKQKMVYSSPPQHQIPPSNKLQQQQHNTQMAGGHPGVPGGPVGYNSPQLQMQMQQQYPQYAQQYPHQQQIMMSGAPAGVAGGGGGGGYPPPPAHYAVPRPASSEGPPTVGHDGQPIPPRASTVQGFYSPTKSPTLSDPNSHPEVLFMPPPEYPQPSEIWTSEVGSVHTNPNDSMTHHPSALQQQQRQQHPQQQRGTKKNMPKGRAVAKDADSGSVTSTQSQVTATRQHLVNEIRNRKMRIDALRHKLMGRIDGDIDDLVGQPTKAAVLPPLGDAQGATPGGPVPTMAANSSLPPLAQYNSPYIMNTSVAAV
eukprot:TRINITY_DN67919_c8_g1_i1.p1 TRINITY_DN67919_c8_g1~~TRINITY_DN67919_c8_g1_i1.p1  ORF type:complete len:824 (-),score=163.78 TRINITY_DN67919_c8_g1_i1:32-2176(-)